MQSNELGKDFITHVYAEGDFFGFVPLLTGGKYEDSAVAIDDTVVKLIPKEDFTSLLFNNRDFAAKFIKMLAHHADHTEHQLIDIAYSSVRRKVASALLTLQDKAADGKFSVLREDLAALTGTAKETAIRTVSDFKSEGLISIEGGIIEIIDIEALKQMPQ